MPCILFFTGSDKCNAESTCIPFEKYMRLAVETYTQLNMKQASKYLKINASMIMTTEDPNIFRQRIPYSRNSSFPLNFIVNEKDTMQGSGSARTIVGHADEVMISSLISLKMQQYGSIVFGNCCSNFHRLMFEFLQQGCGLALKPKLQCLQDTPGYEVCCAWTKGETCDKLKMEHKEWKKSHNIKKVKR